MKRKSRRIKSLTGDLVWECNSCGWRNAMDRKRCPNCKRMLDQTQKPVSVIATPSRERHYRAEIQFRREGVDVQTYGDGTPWA